MPVGVAYQNYCSTQCNNTSKQSVKKEQRSYHYSVDDHDIYVSPAKMNRKYRVTSNKASQSSCKQEYQELQRQLLQSLKQSSKKALHKRNSDSKDKREKLRKQKNEMKKYWDDFITQKLWSSMTAEKKNHWSKT